jgi:uncharacterized membrane protein YhhN
MFLPLLPLPLLIAAIVLLIRAETRLPRDRQKVKLWKSLASAAVGLVALISFTQPTHLPLYSALVLAGLLLSLLGDWWLSEADEQPRRFLSALFAFLFAHLAYILAFGYAQFARSAPFDLNRAALAAGILLLLGSVIYYYARPSLGELRQPALLYITVISLTVHQAVSGVQISGSLLAQPALAVGSALLFYVSAFFLIINRFVFDNEGEGNSVWALSTHYGAQLLVALSASFVR